MLKKLVSVRASLRLPLRLPHRRIVIATKMGTSMRESRKRIPHCSNGRAHRLESLCDRASVLSNKNAAMRRASQGSFSCFICLIYKRACAQNAVAATTSAVRHHVQCFFVVPLRADFFGGVGRVVGLTGARFTLNSSFTLHGATCCFAVAGGTAALENLGDLRMPLEALTLCFLTTELCLLGFPVRGSAIAFVLGGLVAEACLKGVGARTSGTTPDFNALPRVLCLSGRVFA